MKTTKYILSSFLVVSFLLITACDGGEPSPAEETEVEKATKIITANTWKMTNLTVDGVAKSDLFTNMTVKFSATGFTATNGKPVWPDTGTWNFVDEAAKTINRNDGVAVTVDALSENSLTLSLTWTKKTIAGGKVVSVPGKHIFTFAKQ